METLTLTTETSRLLDLVIHSLYTQPEVFLRELVSNASDALDRFRLEALTDAGLRDDASPLEIEIVVDAVARTLTVRDNGIGMDRDDVINHIGTIARSGTKEFEAQFAATHDRDQAAALIGRFGVGFYSCFMVADKVVIVTRRAGREGGTRWESNGDIQYTLSEVPEAPRGTSVTLQLKPADGEGVIDYTDRWELSRIVRRYADFVTYPIVYVGPRAEILDPGVSTDDQGAPVRIVLNSMKPLWTRPESEVRPEEFDEFYKHIANDFDPPQLRMSFKAEGRWEYTALLFTPARAPHDLYYHAASFGLQLYSQRMLIVENCSELLPRYLRFLKGVVDAADLPLNVSRQNLQHAQHIVQIKRWLTRKVLEMFGELHETDTTKYLAFWREFGRALKEGISEDHGSHDRLLPLLLFESSFDAEILTSLNDYVSRMKPEQREIYYLTGESRLTIERSPHLEEFLARGYEVLYFTEPVDELVAQSLPEYKGRRLQSVAKGQIDLGDAAERERIEQEVKAHTEKFGALLEAMAKHLESQVRGVRVSKRLTSSPACLAGEAFDYSPHVERLLRGKGAPPSRRTLEVNGNHQIMQRAQDRFTKDGSDPMVPLTADLLFALALLSEGSELPDPARFTARVADLLAQQLES